MKKGFAVIINSRNVFRTAMLAIVLCGMGTLTLLSSAAAPATTTITIVNNSTWQIRHIYLSPADNDNWGPDQLNNATISPGQTISLSVSWDQATVKLVSEDADGCFLDKTVDATSNAEWTITNDAIPNCGG